MQEIVAQMLNYFWDEFIIINFLPCGRRELSTNLHESGEFARIVVYGLGGYLIEFRVCLAADWNYPRIVIFKLSTNLHESGEFARI